MAAHEHIAQRFQLAQSWWLASELARRNPSLFVYEYHPGGGQYDTLGLFDDRRPTAESVVNLNRADGSIWLGTERRWGPWAAAVASEDPHVAVKDLERWAGLLPEPSPTTTRRTLVYRVIARVLAAHVDSREPFDARLEHLDSPYSNDGARAGHSARFPTAVEAARSYPVYGWFGEPWSHQWALLRGAEPIAVLDVHGWVHTSSGAQDLMAAYRSTGRRLWRTIDEAMGRFLP